MVFTAGSLNEQCFGYGFAQIVCCTSIAIRDNLFGGNQQGLAPILTQYITTILVVRIKRDRLFGFL